MIVVIYKTADLIDNTGKSKTFMIFSLDLTVTSTWTFQIIKHNETSSTQGARPRGGQRRGETGPEPEDGESGPAARLCPLLRRPLRPAWPGLSPPASPAGLGALVRLLEAPQSGSIQSFCANGILLPLFKRATLFPSKWLRRHLQSHWDTACSSRGS